MQGGRTKTGDVEGLQLRELGHHGGEHAQSVDADRVRGDVQVLDESQLEQRLCQSQGAQRAERIACRLASAAAILRRAQTGDVNPGEEGHGAQRCREVLEASWTNRVI